MKLELPNVELVCVDGREDIQAILQSVAAIEYSMRDIRFGKASFFSPFSHKAPQGCWRQTAPVMDRAEDYSRFVLNDLPARIELEHCLIIQWDGFVVDSSKWLNSFLDYDYIGAPWPSSWPQCQTNRVGNGGFSLRSQRLMRRVAELNIREELIRLEDNAICLHHHEVLSRERYQYAPVELAAKFSWENPISEIEPNQSFGFHGRHEKNANYIKLAHEYANPNL